MCIFHSNNAYRKFRLVSLIQKIQPEIVIAYQKVNPVTGSIYVAPVCWHDEMLAKAKIVTKKSEMETDIFDEEVMWNNVMVC